MCGQCFVESLLESDRRAGALRLLQAIDNSAGRLELSGVEWSGGEESKSASSRAAPRRLSDPSSREWRVIILKIELKLREIAANSRNLTLAKAHWGSRGFRLISILEILNFRSQLSSSTRLVGRTSPVRPNAQTEEENRTDEETRRDQLFFRSFYRSDIDAHGV